MRNRCDLFAFGATKSHKKNPPKMAGGLDNRDEESGLAGVAALSKEYGLAVALQDLGVILAAAEAEFPGHLFQPHYQVHWHAVT